MSRRNPGQPLPFSIVENNYGTIFVVDASNDGNTTSKGRVFRSARDPKRRKTTSFLVHAANNYGGLVQHLLDLTAAYQSIPDSVQIPDVINDGRFERAAAYLKKIGETA